jgi:hypothetical protein
MNEKVEVITRSVRDKQPQLIMALLQQPSLEKAAKSLGIFAVTAWRISKTPEFQEEYRQVRREVFEQSLARLQQGGSAAVSTLLKVMEDPKSPAAVRVRAADCVLRHAADSFTLQELAARVDWMAQQMKQMIEEQQMLREQPSA